MTRGGVFMIPLAVAALVGLTAIFFKFLSLSRKRVIPGGLMAMITRGDKLNDIENEAIEGRSTLARIGLTIVQTAMLVYPGHRDRAVTLELANHGPNPILLYKKMKIARVALIELKTPSSESYDDTGKYRNQGIVGKPIFDKEFLD